MSTTAPSGGETRTTARRPWRVVLWCAGALLPTLAFAAAVVLPVTPGPRSFSWVVEGIASLGILAWPLTMFLYLALAIAFGAIYLVRLGPARASRGRLCVMLLCGFALSTGLARPTFRARMWLAARVPARAQPLVEALARFRRDHGHYPASLTALVPDYLPRVPGTGLLGSPAFRYTRADPHDAAGQGQWLAGHGTGCDLAISCHFGLNFDSMHYWPSGNYPRRAWGGVTEKVDGWVYVHEQRAAPRHRARHDQGCPRRQRWYDGGSGGVLTSPLRGEMAMASPGPTRAALRRRQAIGWTLLLLISLTPLACSSSAAKPAAAKDVVHLSGSMLDLEPYPGSGRTRFLIAEGTEDTVRLREWNVSTGQITELAKRSSFLGVSGQPSASVGGLAAPSKDGLLAVQIERTTGSDFRSAVEVGEPGGRWRFIHDWQPGTIRFVFGWNPQALALLYGSTSPSDLSLHVWSSAKGDAVVAGPPTAVYEAAWAPDGKTIYCISSPSALRKTGPARLVAISWPSAKSTVLSEAPAMILLSVAEERGDIVWLTQADSPEAGAVVWRMAPGGKPVKTAVVLPGGANSVDYMEVSPDGSQLAVALAGDRVAVYRVQDGSRRDIAELAGRRIRRLLWANGGTALVAAIGQQEVRLVPLTAAAPAKPAGSDEQSDGTGKPTATGNAVHLSGEVLGLESCPGSGQTRFLVTEGFAGSAVPFKDILRLREWNVDTEQIQDLAERTSYVDVDEQPPAAGGFAALRKDGMLAVEIERMQDSGLHSTIDVRQPDGRWRFIHDWQPRTTQRVIGWSPQSAALLYISFTPAPVEDGPPPPFEPSSLRVWSDGSGKDDGAEVVLADPSMAVYEAAWAPDGKTIYCTSRPSLSGRAGAERLIAISWPSAKSTVLCEAPLIAWPSVAEKSGDVVWLTGGDSPEAAINVWRMAPGGKPTETAAVMPKGVDLMVVSPDGSQVAAVFPGGKVSVYRLQDGSHRDVAGLAECEVHKLLWVYDGTILVAAVGEQEVRLVPVPAGGPEGAPGKAPNAQPGGAGPRPQSERARPAGHSGSQ
jgi:WD40 repeat protein